MNLEKKVLIKTKVMITDLTIIMLGNHWFEVEDQISVFYLVLCVY